MDGTGSDVIVLNNWAVALPRLKIMVRTGRFEFEHGTQEVHARFDPLLDPDRLWMPESESPYYIKPDREGPVPLIPFFSREAVEVFASCFSPRVADRTFIFASGANAESASLFARVVSRTLDGADGQQPYEVLHLILAAIGTLRDWTMPIAVRSRIERMQICVNRSFVDKIEDETGLSFPRAGTEESILGEWPCEPTQTPR